MQKVTFNDFIESFGAEKNSMPKECIDLIAQKDFSYEILEGDEKEKVILEVIKRLETDKQIIGAKERQDVWNNGWGENLQDFIDSGYDLKKLIPKFIRPNQPIRLNGNYIVSPNHTFELDYFKVLRLWVFKKYLKDVDSVYEFGCGTGFNLVELARLYPQKKLHGLDFVPASRDIVNNIAEHYGWNIQGHIFDMVSPDESFQLDKNSAVLTFGSIEQLASKFEAFLQFLLNRQPALCISIEPTVELYDENKLFDYLAIKFHRKRGYTQGFLPRLQELEKNGKIEILKVKRLFFGSLFIEGYNLIIWRPVK